MFWYYHERHISLLRETIRQWTQFVDMSYYEDVRSRAEVSNSFRNTMTWSSDILEFSDFFSGTLCFENMRFGECVAPWSITLGEKSFCSVLDLKGGGADFPLFDFILRINGKRLDQVSGRVTLDNYEISSVPRSILRKKIVLIEAKHFCLPVSIAENIRFGRKRVLSDDVVTACKIFQLHDKIMKLPRGYNTIGMR